MVEQFANSGDPDQMPRSAAFDLGLHFLTITLLGVSRLQWAKQPCYNQAKMYRLYRQMTITDNFLYNHHGFVLIQHF